VKGRFVAIAIACGFALPAASFAQEMPWRSLGTMFRKPALELKQGIEQLRAGKPAVAVEEPKEKPKEEPAEDVAKAPPPKPVMKEKPAEDVAKAPPPKPAKKEELADEVAKAPPPVPSVNPQEPATATAPIPRPRPETVISYAADEPLVPESKSAAAIGALNLPSPSLIKPPPAARSTCGAELAKLGVEAEAIAPISEGSCGIAQPVAVAALGDGATDLTTKAIIECNLAEKFANWLRDEVQPEARKILGGEVTGLRIAASYHCRTRNGVSGAKISEHGRGNAIDISAFKIEGRGWIEVGGAHFGAEARFLKTVRGSACGPFTTVLGPGSDAHHSDHFHFDLATRNKRGKSRGLFCK
jgi:hypothetical protein